MRGGKFLLIPACLVLLPFLGGCAYFGGIRVHDPGGASQGAFFGDVTYPGYIGSRTEVTLDTDDFEILKTVTAETSSTNILGIAGMGDSGYRKLFEQAQEAGADDVINVKVDTRVESLFGPFWTRSTTMLSGTAIRWKK